MLGGAFAVMRKLLFFWGGVWGLRRLLRRNKTGVYWGHTCGVLLGSAESSCAADLNKKYH